jgi:hypothetical protein
MPVTATIPAVSVAAQPVHQNAPKVVPSIALVSMVAPLVPTKKTNASITVILVGWIKFKT